jgi:DNA-binding IclR family transcriptional regulator
MGLAELAGIALAGLDIRDVAQPDLRRLGGITRETINLAIWDRGEAITVGHLPGVEPIKALGWVGQRVPSYCTSVGKVLLAYLDEPSRAAVLDQQLTVYTARTIVDRARLVAELDAIRASGFGFNQAEYQEGLSAVAAPIWDHTGEVRAAVGVSGPAFRLTEERLRELCPSLREGATTISRKLGGRADVSPWRDRRRPAPSPGTDLVGVR